MIKPILCLALAVVILSQSSIEPAPEMPAQLRAPQLVRKNEFRLVVSMMSNLRPP